MTIHIFDAEQKVIEAYARLIAGLAKLYIHENGRFNLVLSGGSSPKRVYELLASPEFRKKIDWTKVYLFFGDERYVPADDPQYNALMAEETLFKPLEVSSDQIFKVDTTLPPEEAAEDYVKKIDAHFGKSPVRFDLVLLGLGDDGHTASLFPFTSILEESKATVSSVSINKGASTRISMTARLINQAGHIAFLVFGAKKAAAVKEVIEGEEDPMTFPAQLICPDKGDLHWFMDNEAAGGLSS